MLRSSRGGSNERPSAVGGDGPIRARPSAGRGRSEYPIERAEGADPAFRYNRRDVQKHRRAATVLDAQRHKQVAAALTATHQPPPEMIPSVQILSLAR